MTIVRYTLALISAAIGSILLIQFAKLVSLYRQDLSRGNLLPSDIDGRDYLWLGAWLVSGIALVLLTLVLVLRRRPNQLQD
ncbi:hypothetical protein I41_37400 [Lacipirellula limnantheis]|uniref:Uncharacterized protein n=1 Tax=Lacipirellula limnantheis TaxID=2528024 RepID=A0A517U1R1_9BACT|nr:hypothetical protein I41_37400 [Lacipirellula limnantheis]